MPRTVAVFGAGIAGLTAAHEFAKLGDKVAVYEANAEAGGFFRSARRREDGHMPSEYSWHGMGPWYHNVFDLLHEIPFDDEGSVFDKGLSRPIDFCLAPDESHARFYRGLPSLPQMFRLGRWEGIRWLWLLLRTWTANRRTEESYSHLSASDAWRPLLTETGWRTWRSSFGPWIGSDWTNVSLHTAGQFCRKQLVTRPAHHHPADAEGPAWIHHARDGWLLLRGPSSECWFDRWVAHLKRNRVEFFWKEPLARFHFDGDLITRAETRGGSKVEADVYVLATTPFAAAEVLDRSPSLRDQDQLRLFRPLVQRGPHVQVSFRIAFAERIRWPRKRTAVIIADSEFNLTLFGQEQAWRKEVSLGEGVASLWTVTACAATVPGPLFGRPIVHCSRDEFLEESMAQLRRCNALEQMIKEANDGRSWKDVSIVRLEVWHEWTFGRDGIEHSQPKWVNTTETQPLQPTQKTPVPNLVLAGAHTKTEADVWSIEAAVESGRRAAKVIEPSVKVIPQYKPLWMRLLSRFDDLCYVVGLPQILDLLLSVAVAAIIAALAFAVLRGLPSS